MIAMASAHDAAMWAALLSFIIQLPSSDPGLGGTMAALS